MTDLAADVAADLEPDAEERAEAERQALKGATVSGGAISFVSQLAKFGLTFAYQVAIARLLLPADFGLVAMVGPVISFVQLFSDMGLTTVTFQHPNISQAQLSFLFWISAGLGLLLAAVAAAISPAVAWFYGDPRLVGITLVAGAMLGVGGFYSQHMALLNRQLRFRALAIVELSSFLVGCVVGLAAALAGFGYWSIVFNTVGTSLTSLVLAWTVNRWRPGRPGRAPEMRALLHFGVNLTGFSIVNFFARSSQNIMLGRVWGETTLGLFDRANRLVLLPFYQIAYPLSRVAGPLLSRSQGDPAFYRRAYERLLESILLLSWPGLVFALATHQPLVERVLGRHWAGVGPIFGVLVLDAFIAPISSSMGWLFVSQGRTAEMRNWGVFSSVLFMACLAGGLHWGAVGVAGGYVVAGLVELAVLWRVTTRIGPMRGASFWALIRPFLASAVLALAVQEALLQAIGSGWVALGSEALAAYAVFGSTIALFPSGRRIMRGVAQQGMRALKPLTRGRSFGSFLQKRTPSFLS